MKHPIMVGPAPIYSTSFAPETGLSMTVITKTPETQVVLRCHVLSVIRCHHLKVFTLPQTMCSVHNLHFLVGFFLSKIFLRKVLSLFIPSLRTLVMVSEAAVMNSDSRSINSLNAFTSSLVPLSQIHCLYFARRFLLNLRCSVM